MSDEILIEEPVIEKSDLELIYEQSDFAETVIREENGFGNVIYTAISSVTLGKKVVSVPQYIEEIENGEVVGRRVVSYEKTTLLIDDAIAVNGLVVISQETAERR